MLLWTKIKQKNLQMCIDHMIIDPSCIHFCIKKHTLLGAWLLYVFFHNHNYQGGTRKFIYKVLVLDNKQLLSNMIDCEATKVSHTTRTAFLADSYIFCSNYPAIFCSSYCYSQLYCYMKAALLNKNSKQLAISYIYRLLAEQYFKIG